jgi:hypothetical protein
MKVNVRSHSGYIQISVSQMQWVMANAKEYVQPSFLDLVGQWDPSSQTWSSAFPVVQQSECERARRLRTLT